MKKNNSLGLDFNETEFTSKKYDLNFFIWLFY